MVISATQMGGCSMQNDGGKVIKVLTAIMVLAVLLFIAIVGIGHAAG